MNSKQVALRARLDGIEAESITAFDDFYLREKGKFETRNEISRASDAWDSAVAWVISKLNENTK